MICSEKCTRQSLHASVSQFYITLLVTRSEEGNKKQQQWLHFLTLSIEREQGDGYHSTDCTVPPLHFEVCLRLCWASKVQQWVTTQNVLHPNSFFFSLLLLFLRIRNGYVTFLGHFSHLVRRDKHYLAVNAHIDRALIPSSDFSERCIRVQEG